MGADQPMENRPMATFRACSFIPTDRQSTVLLTDETQATLPDADLIEAAVAEARNANLIGADCPHVTEDRLRAGLEIGDYNLA